MTIATIQLTKIVSDPRVDAYNDNEEGEGPARVTTPTTILADSIRCFYPRRDDRPGTRITFRDGGGFAVTETKAEIDQLLAAL